MSAFLVLYHEAVPWTGSGEPLRPWEKQGLGTQEGTSSVNDRQTDTTHKRVVGICCDFTEFMFSLYSIQTKNKSEGHISSIGTV